MELLIDFYRGHARLGPGSDAHTRRALDLSGLFGKSDLQIADLGCGTGASTLVLAQELDARITAVDLFPEFLDALRQRAGDLPIETLAASFDALPFQPASLDCIWSEGAIYNLGFEAGVAAWGALLRPGGVLAVSELTWLSHQRPTALQAHWEREYPQVDTASAKLAVLERQGFTSVGYFPLPWSCWQAYYAPLQASFDDFLIRWDHSEPARALVAEIQAEMALMERYREHVSYGFYIARKLR